MIKMHCMICKEPKELTREELKETAKFVRDNELDSDGYEDFISTKIGKKCKGTDGKTEKLKKHKYMIDDEDLNEICNIANKIKSNIDEYSKFTDKIVDIDSKIFELTKEKVEIQEKLPTTENLIKESREKLIDLVEDDREILWI